MCVHCEKKLKARLKSATYLTFYNWGEHPSRERGICGCIWQEYSATIGIQSKNKILLVMYFEHKVAY